MSELNDKIFKAFGFASTVGVGLTLTSDDCKEVVSFLDGVDKYLYSLEAELARLQSMNARLIEDGERLEARYDIRWCMTRCGIDQTGYVHAPDCPITLHRQLMEEVEEK